MQFSLTILLGLAATVMAETAVTIWEHEDCTGEARNISVSGDCQNTTPGFSSLTLLVVPGTQDGIGIRVQTGNCGENSDSKTIPYSDLENKACSGGFGFTANDVYQSRG